MAAKTFADLAKFNPYHDSKGRFASSSSAASFTYAPGKSTAHDAAIQREKDADGAAATGKGFKGTLYHGSPATDIEEFDMSLAGKNTSSGEKLLFFTDSKQMAEDFSYERLEGSSKYFQRRGKKGRVYEVDVEMKNPLDFRNLSDKDIDNILKLDVDGILTKDMVKMYAQKNHQLLKSGLELTAESLKVLGYDGMIANTGKAGHNSLEYAVVDSSQAQIKKGAAMVAKTFNDVLKANPYRDARGRFTTASGGGGLVPTVKRESVLSAIKELPACNDSGETIETHDDWKSEMCVNPVPFIGNETNNAIDDLMEKIAENGIDPWDDEHSSVRSVNVSSIKANQPALDRVNMFNIMNEGLSDLEFEDEICIVKFQNQYVLHDGNHRTALAKLAGRTSIKARVYDADKKSGHIEKFNPYHDSRGRFASANSATSFTIRTRDPGKQSLATAAAAREKERDATGAAAPAEEKETPRMQSIHSVEDRIRNQNYESAAIIDKDGNELLFKDGSQSMVGFSPAECAMMKGNTLTHNHPRSSMFSDEDIKCFETNDMLEMRATNREGITYSIKQGAGYTPADGKVFLLEYQINSGLARATAQSELDARGFAEKIMRGEMSHAEANKEFGKVVTRELTSFCEKKAPEYNLEFTVESRNVGKSAGTDDYIPLDHNTAKAADNSGDSIVLDKETEEKNDAAFNEWLEKNNIPKEETKKSFSIYKTNDDKRLVFGWASVSITADGEQLEDLQHDMIDPEDLEEAVYEYVLNFRDTGERHNPNLRKKGKLVESCVFTVEKQKAMGIPEGTLPIGWWIGFKIEDDAAWEKVKNGTYRMFSIEGKANRVAVDKAAPAEQDPDITEKDLSRFDHIEEFP